MSHTASVRAAVTVDLEPDAAFAVFTEEIDCWYRRGPHSFADPRAVGIRFEAGVGGRLIHVVDADTGEGLTAGKITVWEPGRRLVYVDDRGTEIDVTFDAEDGQTRVVLEHRGLERLRPDLADRHGRFGGRLLLSWYVVYVRARQSKPNDEGSRT